MTEAEKKERYAICLFNLASVHSSPSGLLTSKTIVDCYIKALELGNKYIYQSLPRVLTIWLDTGESDILDKTPAFQGMNEMIARALHSVPPYKVRRRLRRK